jgi:DNA repair protein RadB
MTALPAPPRVTDRSGRTTTGSPPIDELLGGGLEPDGLTQLYGEGGTGKTVLCLSAAVACALAGRWVLYIDTEGVSADRLRAMSGGDPDRVLRRLLLSSPKGLPEQTDAVHTACALVRDGRRPIGLVVLDSATMYYRLTLNTPDEEDARTALVAELAELLGTGLRAGVPVLFTNKVYRSMESGALEPIGGPFVNHLSKTILRLERAAGERRRAVLVKHRSLPPAQTTYRITARGIE